MKRFKMIGIIALAVIIGFLLAACSDDVSLKTTKPPQASDVTVTKTANNMFFIVSWKAAKGNENGLSYNVVLGQEEKNNFSSGASWGGQNVFKYDEATGEDIPNDDYNQWSVRIANLSAAATEAGSYRFGVRTALYNPMTWEEIYSDTKWSESFPLTALPAPSVSVELLTNKAFLISWNAISGAANYQVNININSSNHGNFIGQNIYKYDTDGNAAANDNPDKWSYYYNQSILGTYVFRLIVSSSDISVLPGFATAIIQK